MLINKICELHILQFTIQILFWICVLVQKHKTYVSDSKTLLSFTSWQNGYCASREPTFRHDILCSLVGWAASSTEAASDPLALLGLIIAGPLGMLEQVSNWARLHHITPTPHCWQVPRGQVMSWHGCPVSELVPGLPLTCPPPHSSSSFSSMEKREQTVRMGHWGCQLVPAARGDIQGGGHLS